MLSAGSQITAPRDPLRRITADELYNQIKQPSAEVEQKIKSLRLVYTLDKKRYDELKRTLPYVVCAAFHPELRLTAYFAKTDCFIVDLDHVGAHSMNVEQLKSRLSADSRVMMAFVSPSGDGLKLLFSLKSNCYDAGEFTAFYKVFVERFALQYGLADVIDSRTHDVCRACFVSYDPTVYYNADAEPIDWIALLPRRIDEPAPEPPAPDTQVPPQSTIEPKTHKEPKTPAEPDKDVMDRIKAQLNLSKPKSSVTREFFVPEQIERVMVDLREKIVDLGVTITEERDIQYGKQVRFAASSSTAELNIFFGKRGFSVVASTRRGTSPELNHLIAEYVSRFLSSTSYW